MLGQASIRQTQRYLKRHRRGTATRIGGELEQRKPTAPRGQGRRRATRTIAEVMVRKLKLPVASIFSRGRGRARRSARPALCDRSTGVERDHPETKGWATAQPGLLADLKAGHYFS